MTSPFCHSGFIHLSPSVKQAPTKAAAAKFIPLAPSPAFVAVDFGGEVGMGHPVMGATVTTFKTEDVRACVWPGYFICVFLHYHRTKRKRTRPLSIAKVVHPTPSFSSILGLAAQCVFSTRHCVFTVRVPMVTQDALAHVTSRRPPSAQRLENAEIP